MSKTNGTGTAAAPLSTPNAIPTGGGGNQGLDTMTANPPDSGSGDPAVDDGGVSAGGGDNAIPTGGGGSGLTTESARQRQ